MRVEITQVLAEGRVVFHSALGSASGLWAGSTPARTGEFDVEMEIPEEIAEWTVLDAPSRDSIEEGAQGRSHVSITGSVVPIGEADDSVVGIKLGPDILLIEAPDLKSGIASGSTVSMNVSSILLYPYQL